MTRFDAYVGELEKNRLYRSAVEEGRIVAGRLSSRSDEEAFAALLELDLFAVSHVFAEEGAAAEEAAERESALTA